MYPHILSKLSRTVWAATPQTVESVRSLLDSRMGRTFEPPQTADQGAALPAVSAQAAAMFGDRSDSRDKKPYSMYGTTAIVPVFGVIGKHLSSLELFCGGCGVDQICSVLDAAAQDDEVEQILMWYHTPGGVVTGVPEAARFIRAVDEIKPVYAYTDGMMCSAGYWLASQCRNIFASPSSDVGSIGVYLSWINAREAYEAEGLKLELFKAGEFKAMGHPLKDLTDAEADMLQADVDYIWSEFKAACTSRRTLAESTMQGQTFSYAAQLETGLVDQHFDTVGELLRQIEGS